MGTEEINRYWR